jgi:competence ComEA-like helix-hairpin-helix protein
MAQRDAIQILEKDHRNVKSLLAKLKRASGSASDCGPILSELAKAVHEHTTIEEEIFYPAFHDAVRGKRDEKLFYESTEEHHVVDLVLPEVERAKPATMAFAAKVKVLGELLTHHLDEEESTLFPKARRALGAAKLVEIGEALTRRKEELEGKAKPRAAQKAPKQASQRRAEKPSPRGRRRPAKLDLNSAEVEDLERIKGISATRARSLIDHRESHGAFQDWDEVLAVRGISRSLVQRMQGEATIGH